MDRSDDQLLNLRALNRRLLSGFAQKVIPNNPPSYFLRALRRVNYVMVDKKTVAITVKASPEMKREAAAIIAKTGPGTPSRYIRAVLSDLINKTREGERLAEPPQLLTEAQRRILEQSE